MKISLDTKNDGLRLHIPPIELQKLAKRLLWLAVAAIGAAVGGGGLYSTWRASASAEHKQIEAPERPSLPHR